MAVEAAATACVRPIVGTTASRTPSGRRPRATVLAKAHAIPRAITSAIRPQPVQAGRTVAAIALPSATTGKTLPREEK